LLGGREKEGGELLKQRKLETLSDVKKGAGGYRVLKMGEGGKSKKKCHWERCQPSRTERVRSTEKEKKKKTKPKKTGIL